MVMPGTIKENGVCRLDYMVRREHEFVWFPAPMSEGSFGWIRLVVVPLPGFSIRVANSVGEKPCNLEN